MINLRDKSLGIPFINLIYFPFAYGDEIPLKFVKSLIFYDQDCIQMISYRDGGLNSERNVNPVYWNFPVDRDLRRRCRRRQRVNQ